jgi:hypothetical protein
MKQFGLSALPIGSMLTLGHQVLDVPKLVMLGGCVLLGVGVTWVLARPTAPRAQQDQDDTGRSLRYEAADIWALDRFCASIGEVQRAMPELRSVSIDLCNVPELDASSLACLDHAVQRLMSRGIRVAIQGCTAEVEVELRRRGLSGEPGKRCIVSRSATDRGSPGRT